MDLLLRKNDAHLRPSQGIKIVPILAWYPPRRRSVINTPEKWWFLRELHWLATHLPDWAFPTAIAALSGRRSEGRSREWLTIPGRGAHQYESMESSMLRPKITPIFQGEIRSIMNLEISLLRSHR